MGKVKYRVLAILTLFTVLGGTLFSLPGYAAGAGPTFKQQFNPEGTEAGAHTAEVVAAACRSTVDTVIDAAMIEKTTSLSMGYAELTQIDGIEIFSNLKSLDLYSNKFTSLPENIGKLENLEQLRLEENELISLPDSIGDLKNLNWLTLYKNQLTVLPDSIAKLENLEYIDMSTNQFVEFPESVLKLLGLKTISLSRNQLTSLPESIGNLVNLQMLELSRNQLTSLPESIGNLEDLQKLCLGVNQLTSLPESIGNLEKLQELRLWNNQLISLPDSIGNLVNLQILYLNGNQLTRLPESIGNLVELQLLYLNDNQLTSLPESIGNLKNLNRELMLGNNLLPTGYAATLNRLHEGWSFPEEPQDQLILKTEGLPRESIRTQADLAAYVQIKRINEDGSEVYIDPSLTHQYNLENEADYFDAEGNAMKDGTVSAAIRAMGSGLFENNSDRAVTTEPITLTIQSLYHPVKFDPNGTGVNQMPESQEILRGRLLTKPEAEPQRAGYTFLKWSTDPEGLIAWNFDSDTMPDEAITLYATWEAIPESSDLSTSNTVNTGIPGRNEQMVLALGTVLMSLLGALGILKISSSFHKR